MTPAPPAAGPGHDDLPARVFRALYQDHDLHTINGTRIAVPKGTPVLTAPTLGEIARQISNPGRSDLAGPPAGPPVPAHLPVRPVPAPAAAAPPEVIPGSERTS